MPWGSTSGWGALTRYRRGFAASCMVLALCCGAVGCSAGRQYSGAKRHSVVSTVTLDGVPVAEGTMFLDPIEEGERQRRRSGGPVVGGQCVIHEARGPHAGLYRVSFSDEVKVADVEGGRLELKTLPRRYWQNHSDIEIEIGGNKGSWDFDLTSD